MDRITLVGKNNITTYTVAGKIWPLDTGDILLIPTDSLPAYDVCTWVGINGLSGVYADPSSVYEVNDVILTGITETIDGLLLYK